MRFKTKVVFLLLALSFLAASAGCGRTEVTEEFFQSYQVRSGTVLEIYNPNGSVTVTGWDGNEVEIAALKTSFYGQSALDEVDIYIDIAETLVIRTEHPEGAAQASVSYEIKIPEDLLVGVIECSNGDIILQDAAGNPTLTTSNGSITATNVNGIVTARSSNGNLTATGVRSLEELRTSNGNIVAEFPVLHGNLEIRTSNGSISLSLPANLAADLEASTSNGSINVANLNVETTILEQNNLVGSMNGGGHKITLTTSNGSIELARLR